MILVSRFIAGTRISDAIAAARKVNARGMNAIIDYLGEDVTSADAAHAAAEEYLRLIQCIENEQVRAAISLKASQMGLLISRDVCIDNIARIAERAEHAGIFVWFDMEGSALTRKTIEVFEEIRERRPSVGLCLQASLVRTGGDFDQLAKNPFHLRLCKGAYKESPSIAYTTKNAVDGNYKMLVQKALEQTTRGVYPAFATHDDALLDFIVTQASDKKIAKSGYEFQMLYGIHNDRLVALAGNDHKTSVYIPYGSHWFPYFMRRLRERKENVYFLLRNLFRN